MHEAAEIDPQLTDTLSSEYLLTDKLVTELLDVTQLQMKSASKKHK